MWIASLHGRSSTEIDAAPERRNEDKKKIHLFFHFHQCTHSLALTHTKMCYRLRFVSPTYNTFWIISDVDGTINAQQRRRCAIRETQFPLRSAVSILSTHVSAFFFILVLSSHRKMGVQFSTQSNFHSTK